LSLELLKGFIEVCYRRSGVGEGWPDLARKSGFLI